VLKKKIWANFQRIIELFTKKVVKKLLKIWSWDQGSEIRDPEKTYSESRIPDPRVKKHPILDPGSGSATLLDFKVQYWRERPGHQDGKFSLFPSLPALHFIFPAGIG
jgi:hypothetical protein